MNSLLRSIFLIAILFTTVSGCKSSGGSSGGGASSDTNQFTMSGNPLTVDHITSSVAATSISPQSTSQVYYGRVLYQSGSNLYGAAIHFTLNKSSSTTVYFSDFYLDRFVDITSFSTATEIVNSSTDLVVTAAYSTGSNGLTITNASSRFVRFDLNFGNNTYFNDITNAGVLFSRDGSTMAGGDNSSFIFIAQKASSMSVVSISDIISNWNLANFRVSSSTGTITVSSTSAVSPAGTGGNGLTAFTGYNSNVGTFQGELDLTDAATGIYIFGFDSDLSYPPTAFRVDGAFLLSPDKQYILGYNVYDGVYFAASR